MGHKFSSPQEFKEAMVCVQKEVGEQERGGSTVEHSVLEPGSWKGEFLKEAMLKLTRKVSQ